MDMIKLLIEKKANFVQPNSKGAPPLLFLTAKEFEDVERIIDESVDIEFFYLRFDDFKKGLPFALKKNRKDYISKMGRHFPEFDEQAFYNSFNNSSYIDVVKKDDSKLYFSLVKCKKGNVNYLDKSGWSALHHASHNGSLCMVKLLCGNRKIEIDNCLYESSLHVAASGGRLDVVELLLDSGASVTKKTAFKKNNTTKKNYNEDSSLHLALRNCHLAIAARLLEENASLLLMPNHWDNIPLHIAVMSDSFDCVSFLLTSWDPTGQVNAFNCNGETPLHYAYKYTTDFSIVDLLLQHGACPTLKNNRGHIPSEIKSKHNNTLKKSNVNKPLVKVAVKLEESRPMVPPVQEEELDSHEKLCAICMENEKNCLLKPCRHIVTCVECSQLISECPICRVSIQKRSKVFIA